jgi:inner membrane protein
VWPIAIHGLRTPSGRFRRVAAINFLASMDNLAHTLAGLAMAEAGLRRKTAFGATTLAIAANLPDVDALIYVVGDGIDALAFRRGWTHGILAMVVLPLVLAACMRAVGRLRQSSPGAPTTSWRWLIILAAVGVWSHPLLDLLNTYGVRLLMPFSDRWFYGDTLFIIDPWLWLTLLAGIVLSRRRALHDMPRSGRPARVALVLLGAYLLGMAASSRWGRRFVAQSTGGTTERVMIAPEAISPFRRRVVRDLGTQYEIGELTLGSLVRYRPTGATPSGRDHALASAVARTPDGKAFLSWSRFPRFAADSASDGLYVRISDVRYADEQGRGWASVRVRLSAAETSDDPRLAHQ